MSRSDSRRCLFHAWPACPSPRFQKNKASCLRPVADARPKQTSSAFLCLRSSHAPRLSFPSKHCSLSRTASLGSLSFDSQPTQRTFELVLLACKPTVSLGRHVSRSRTCYTFSICTLTRAHPCQRITHIPSRLCMLFHISEVRATLGRLSSEPPPRHQPEVRGQSRPCYPVGHHLPRHEHQWETRTHPSDR